LEFLLTLSETGKGMTRKLSSYCDEVIKTAFQFMIELDTPLEEWCTTTINELQDLEEKFNVGLEAIGRLACSLGSKIVLPRAIPIIQQFLSSPTWSHRHAALMSLGHISDGCQGEMKKQLEQVVGMVIPHASDNNPRVQWAAVDALAQFSDQFKPVLQQKFHKQVIGSLLSGMTSSQPHVVAHSALCLVDFCKGLYTEDEKNDATLIISNYADSIFDVLQKIIQMNHIKVQEATIAAIASVAMVCKEHFVKYYAAFMQGVKSILTGANSKHQRELRGRAIECIALMARAVGRERFAPDFKSVMEFLITTQKNGLASDDPQYNYVVQACARICQCVGDAFIPYLSFVIPPLLKSVSINNAFQFCDIGKTNPDEGKNGFQSMTVSLRGGADKRVTINTSLLQEQGVACKMLYQYAHELKDGFFPFVEDTAKVIIPLVYSPYSEMVRLSASSALHALLISAKKHFKKKGMNDNGYIARLWNAMLPSLLKAIQVEIHTEDLADRFDVLADCLEAVNCPLSAEQIRVMNELISAIVKESLERRNQLESRRTDVDFDEQENVELEIEHEQEDALINTIYRCIFNAVENTGEAYVESFHHSLFPLFSVMLNPNRKAGEQCIALCVMDGIVQHGGVKARQYVDNYLPITKQYSLSKDVDIRQAALFGIGVCAESLGMKFGAIGEEYLSILLQVITATGSRNEENGPATDNAISSLGRICRSCYKDPPIIQGKNMLELWLRMLPLKDDEEEASSVVTMLCDFVDQQNPYLLGANNANLPKIVSIFSQSMNTDVADEKTKKRIKVIMNRLQNSLSPQQMQEAMTLVNEKEKAKMQSILAAVNCSQ